VTTPEAPSAPPPQGGAAGGPAKPDPPSAAPPKSRVVARPGARADRRWIALALTAAAIAVGGTVISLLGSGAPVTRAEAPDARMQPAEHAADARVREVRTRFDQAVIMLHAHEYEHAVTALHRVLELAPDLPEAHANMGFALLGLKRVAAARDFFESALALQPMQANAYYGVAMAFEELGDMPGAIGAMRSYLHLARNEDPRHLSRARAALWEWEARAGGAGSGPAMPGMSTPPAK